MSGRKQKDPVQEWIKAAKKKLKKKAFRLKVKLVLSAVLPGLAAFLATVTARLFLRMILRKAGTSAKPDAGPDEPAYAVWKPADTDTAASSSEKEPAEGESPGPVKAEPVTLRTEKPEFVPVLSIIHSFRFSIAALKWTLWSSPGMITSS